MQIFVLFGQRKCAYPGQYALEALDCIDEIGQSDNPEYLAGKLEHYRSSGEFDRLAIVALAASESDIRARLYPDGAPVAAAVVDPQ